MKKRCKARGKLFDPVRSTQVVCCPECAFAWSNQGKGKQAAEKVIRAATRERKAAAKPRSKWLAECQAIVNRYARLRDAKDGCISCDRPASWGGQWHGSHYRSVGAASAVRLNLWNIHKACSICNHHLSWNIAAYKPRLIEKIGAEKVAWLEAQNQVVRYDIEYLKRYKRVIGKRLAGLEKRNAVQSWVARQAVYQKAMR